MATDVAELLGAALGLNLLLGMLMALAGAAAAVLAFAILRLDSTGHRRCELAIGSLLLLITIGIAYEVLRMGPSDRSTMTGLIPHLGGNGSGS